MYSSITLYNIIPFPSVFCRIQLLVDLILFFLYQNPVAISDQIEEVVAEHTFFSLSLASFETKIGDLKSLQYCIYLY